MALADGVFDSYLNTLQRGTSIVSNERRSFLKASLKLCTAASVFPACGSAFASDPNQSNPIPSDPILTDPIQSDPIQKETERQLRLANVHTGEILDVVYWADGKYIPDHVGQLNWFMRDHRAKESARMHIRLYDTLNELQNSIGSDSRIHVLSGFRTSGTNEYLRKRSNAVAKNSFHIKGRAVDLYIPEVDAESIMDKARKIGRGGVGYYKNRNFVHLDTGRPRFWVKT